MHIQCRRPWKGQSVGQVSSASSPISHAWDPPSDRFYSGQRLLDWLFSGSANPLRPIPFQASDHMRLAQVPPAPRSAFSLGPFPHDDAPRPGRLQPKRLRSFRQLKSVSSQVVLTRPGPPTLRLRPVCCLGPWHLLLKSLPSSRLQPFTPPLPPQDITPWASQPRSRPTLGAVFTQRGPRRRTASSSLCGRPRLAAPSPPLPSRSCP